MTGRVKQGVEEAPRHLLSSILREHLGGSNSASNAIADSKG